MDAGDGALLADALVRADLRAIHSHGVLRVPDYVAKLTRDDHDRAGFVDDLWPAARIILSTLLSGAAYGTELGNMVDGPRAGADGHVFMALGLAAFGDSAAFKRRVDTVVRQIHASAPAPGFARCYAPGALEAEYEARYARDGIPLNDATRAGVAAAARERGVDEALIAPIA